MENSRRKRALDNATGDTKEDWEIFEILCMQHSEMEEDTHDIMTALKSELAALQYKRDRLLSELNEMRAQVRCRDQRTVELESETENLKEQAARQNAIIISLKKRIQELEEKERTLSLAQARSESAIQTLQRENKYQEDKNKELNRRVRAMEVECHAEEQSKLAAREALNDFIRKLSNSLGTMESTDGHSSQECLVRRAADIVLETSKLRTKAVSLGENLHAVELELKGCREALERACADRDNFQKQAASHLLELNKLKQEKEELEIQQRLAERELCELKEKLSFANKSLGCASVNNAAQEATINQLRDECKIKEEKGHRLQNELRHLLETLAMAMSTPIKFVDSTEEGVKTRVKDIIQENKEKSLQNDSLKEKVNHLSIQLAKQTEIDEETNHRMRMIGDEKAVLETKLAKMEEDLHNCNVARESLKADKATFMDFLERLGQALNSEEFSKDVELDLLTESLLIRAERLARLETNKIVDKHFCCQSACCNRCPPHLTKLKRERSFPDLSVRETSAMYQLQRKLRNLKEQLQRKDLHLDLLRRKLAVQEENVRARSAIAIERDEATMKCKKLMKQIEKLQMQLADGKTLSHDIKNQLAEAGDFKIAALERGRKVEELQKRLVDAESIICRCNKKITNLKEQLRNSGLCADQERTISEHSLQLLRDDLANTKLTLAESTRRENQMHTFRTSICKTLGLPPTSLDYELLNKLEKLAAVHRDFTLLSRRYDEPLTGKSTPVRTPKYEDSGFLDPQELSALEDNDDLFHKHSH